jgi:hypothetical protein
VAVGAWEMVKILTAVHVTAVAGGSRLLANRTAPGRQVVRVHMLGLRVGRSKWSSKVRWSPSGRGAGVMDTSFTAHQ